jgi:hypothetical protein
MSNTLRRTLLAALVAAVAGGALADGAFAQSKGDGGHGNDRGGGVSRGGTESSSGPEFDANAARAIAIYDNPRHYNRKPRVRVLPPSRETSCEVDGDLNVYNSADRRKCNLPTKRMRQAYVSCETVYVAVPGGYVPERVCTRGE